MSWTRNVPAIERGLVFAIAAHSYAVGLALIFATDLVVRFGGWDAVMPRFFARQGGAFHLVVATGYLLEYAHHRGVSLMIFTKALAVVFLVAMAIVEPGAWSVPFSAAADGMMGVTIWLVHRRVTVSVPMLHSGLAAR
jgi:hypothetical protein